MSATPLLTRDVKRGIFLVGLGLAMYALAFSGSPGTVPKMLYLVAGTLFELGAIIVLVRSRGV